jgi:hypothetical protein
MSLEHGFDNTDLWNPPLKEDELSFSGSQEFAGLFTGGVGGVCLRVSSKCR